jgi:hypothetical protein
LIPLGQFRGGSTKSKPSVFPFVVFSTYSSKLDSCIKQQKHTTCVLLFVELEGFEPSSKQGSHELST